MKEAILQQKQGIVEDIKTKFETCKSAVLIDYRGLTVEEVTNLRNKFREAGVEYRVLKNTMIRRAVDALGLEGRNRYWKDRPLWRLGWKMQWPRRRSSATLSRKPRRPRSKRASWKERSSM